MAKTLTIDDLLQRNEHLSKNHEPMPLFSEMRALGMPPPKVAIVTCADSRSCPERIFELKVGEGLVLRTPGGRIGPVLQSIVVLDTWIGVNEVMIVHHTDCGATSMEEETIRAEFLRRAPQMRAEIEKMSFGTFTDPYQSVRDDVSEFRASPLVGEELKRNTRGFVHDIKSGIVNEIDVPMQ